MKLIEYIFGKHRVRDKMFWLRFVLGVVMMALLVAQLFTYEEFYSALSVAQYDFGHIAVTMLMVGIPIYELIALPALFSIDLRPDIVRASAYSARGVALLWTILTLIALIVAPGQTTAILGDTIEVPAHFAALVATALFAGAVWYVTIGQVEQPKKK